MAETVREMVERLINWAKFAMLPLKLEKFCPVRKSVTEYGLLLVRIHIRMSTRICV